MSRRCLGKEYQVNNGSKYIRLQCTESSVPMLISRVLRGAVSSASSWGPEGVIGVVLCVGVLDEIFDSRIMSSDTD